MVRVEEEVVGTPGRSLIMDEEVFAVLLAVTVVASVFAAAMILRPSVVEPFMALGLLNERCKIGDYPKWTVVGDNLTLCIFVANYEGKPVLYKVVYKVGTNETLPTNSTPSPEPPVLEWYGALDHGENKTFPVRVPALPAPSSPRSERVALIFELWTYNTTSKQWEYRGIWTHLYVELRRPGGGGVGG